MQNDIAREKIIQNLKDADCDEKIIEAFMKAFDSGRDKQALAILAKHRKALLDRFHKYNDCICRLDYLDNKIKTR